MRRILRALTGRRLVALAGAGMLLGATVTLAGERVVQAATDSGFGWEDGTLQGWNVDWDAGAPSVSTTLAFSGDHSLALPLTGEQYPGFRSPSRLTGIGVGSVVTYHVYAPEIGASLQVRPYVTDGSYTEHFAAKTNFASGDWTTVTWTIPSVTSVRYIGLEIDDPGWTGEVYLDDVSWTPPTELPPVVATGPAGEVRSTTALLTGTVNPSGLATICHFDYGTTKRYGSATPDDSTPGSGTGTVDVSARLTGLKAGTTYRFRLSCQNSGGMITDGYATFTTSSAVSDPRGPIFDAQNLIYGSHIGAWDMDGGTAVNNPTAAANVTAAKIRVIKWQMWKPPCDLRPIDCQSTAQFNAAIDGIRSLGAEPLVGLPPIWNQQCTGAVDAWSHEWQEWIIRTAGSRVKLYEMGNEPDNYCAMTGQQYHDELWVNVPPLKAYARTLGLQIFVGGPAWAKSDTDSLTEIKTWLNATKQDYLSHAEDRDWIPDFVSTHTYLITPSENDTQAHAQARINLWGAFYDDLESFIGTTFAGLTDQGFPIADQLKLADTEWNDTIENTWPGNDDRTWTDYYVSAMFTMLRNHGVWLSNQSTIASHTGGALDLLTTDGTAKPEYLSYLAVSTSDPLN
jgi:hypothetical protein